MILEVKDPVLVAVAARVAGETAGVARLYGSSWLPGLPGSRSRLVGVERAGGQVIVSLRLVLERDATVLDVVRAVQRSVRDEVRRLTGLAVDVGVVVVDLD